MSRLTLLMLAVLLGGCAARSAAAPAVAERPRVAESPVRCGDPVRMQPGRTAWTLEGFGGRDAQLMVTERRAHTRCSEGPGTAASPVANSQ